MVVLIREPTNFRHASLEPAKLPPSQASRDEQRVRFLDLASLKFCPTTDMACARHGPTDPLGLCSATAFGLTG